MKIAPVLSKLGGPGVKKEIKKDPSIKSEEKNGALHPGHSHSKMEEEIMSLSRSRLVRLISL